ncbi:heterokaryon incompatibility protein-domain-containing protein [Chaetomium strumarium]|uniref:Heterokaryon incompatibility protein-domain-containing protein n=1 Tax=Chaetomium strumarium TaxID=1170767 RepID=A0AAJ0GXQ6_9PEZI|nr:heterokaryon incompatibility protein-domain-containing protein [Chaetomium strumarium]
MPPSSNFSYQPLAHGQEQIRILQLLPSVDKHAEVSATFQVESVTQPQHPPPDFEALSYMWGDQTDRVIISLDGHAFSLSRRLRGTLQDLREATRPRRLWIDAICINQADVEERNQQVKLMRMIYQRARTVLIWLDRPVHVGHPAIQQLQRMSDKSEVAELGDNPDFWDPVCNLFRDPYWSRIWIQQEISLASALRLFCRETELSVYSLYHFLRILRERATAEVLQPSKMPWSAKQPRLSLPRRFGRPDSHLQPREGTTFSASHMDLLPTLSATNRLGCSDDKDRVYGVMFLARCCDEEDIRVDYTLTVPEVYTEVARFLLTKYRSTRFLLYSSPDQDPTAIADRTPSWVPDWRYRSLRPWGAGRLASLVAAVDAATAKPNAGSHVAAPEILNGGVLSLLAIKVDAVAKTYHHLFRRGVLSMSLSGFDGACTLIIRDAIKQQQQQSFPKGVEPPGDDDVIMSNNPEEEKEEEEAREPWKALMRTLGALDHRDKNSRLRFEPGLYRGAWELLNYWKGARTDIDATTYRLANAREDGACPEYARHFVSVVWMVSIKGYTPFLSVDGRMGLAPPRARADDEIWLVPGCELPMLLRRCPDGKFLVVGWGYVDGVNLWEPVGGFKAMDEVGEGERIAGFSVERIQLR